jgi:hypothetical protein
VSYDYMLFRAPSPAPMGAWAAVPPPALGSAEELKGRIEALFPGVAWRSLGSLPGGWWGTFEIGERYAEFSLVPIEDGTIRFVTMKRCEREEVERVCRALGWVAVDPGVSLFRPDVGAWRRDG